MQHRGRPEDMIDALECSISTLSGLAAALCLIDAAGPDQARYWPAIHALHGLLADTIEEAEGHFICRYQAASQANISP